MDADHRGRIANRNVERMRTGRMDSWSALLEAYPKDKTLFVRLFRIIVNEIVPTSLHTERQFFE
jgi:hypothetical protein